MSSGEERWSRDRCFGMTKRSKDGIVAKQHFARGDHVSWHSEAGRVRGAITRMVTSQVQFKGYTVHASQDEPQYQIKRDTTYHTAMHKGSALTMRAG